MNKRIFIIAMLSLLLSCTTDNVTYKEAVPRFPATIYLPDGATPAACATVKIFDSGAEADRPLSLRITDNSGSFSIDELPIGHYNILAEKDSFVLFQEVEVESTSTTLHDDTLECPSSLTGTIGVQIWHDPRTAWIRVLGTDRLIPAADRQGRFTLTGLAGGTYSLLIGSILAEYQSVVKTVTLAPCSFTTIDDTLRLVYTGIPIVSGIRPSQDTIAGTIRLSWEKTEYGDVRDYVVYKDNCGDVYYSEEPFHTTTDTFFIDSICADPGESAVCCFKYRVAVRDSRNKVGPTYRYTEVKVASQPKVISVSTNLNHTLILKNDATLWGCGRNNYGHLADGTTETRLLPVRVMTGVQNMAAGRRYSLILKLDNTLWACGWNTYGQLGDRTTENRVLPVMIMTDVRSIAAGYFHSLILKTDGTLWACGSLLVAQPITGDITTIFIGAWTGSRPVPIQVMTDVQSMSAGDGHSLIRKTDNTLWACGLNDSGQLGDGTTIDRGTPVQVMSDVQNISAGYGHSLILKTDNTLWSCGSNESGQLGDGTTTNRATPVHIMSDVQSISAGSGYSLILKTDGTLWACGDNRSGQLGDGTTENHATPVRVMADVQSMSAGSGHSLILKTDGTLWACGYNKYGQLGDGTTEVRLVPVRVLLPLESSH